MAREVDAWRRHQGGQSRHHVERLDKIAGSNFEQPKAGPKGGGQDARRSTTSVVPSRYGVFKRYRIFPWAVSDSRSVETAGRVIVRHRRSNFSRSCASLATKACNENPAARANLPSMDSAAAGNVCKVKAFRP